MASRVSQYRQAQPALVEQRNAPRHFVRVESMAARHPSDAQNDACLHDLSIFGCRLESTVRCAVGDSLWLRFQGRLPIAAKVVWADGGFVGCRFDAPVAGALVRSLTIAQ